jgi:hypothetical protein
MRLLVWFALVAGLLMAGPAQAQVTPGEQAVLNGRAADVLAVLQGKRAESEVFNRNFQIEVSEQKLAAIVSQLEAQLGKLTGASVTSANGPGTASVDLQFERATAGAVIALDPGPPRLVSGFRIVSVGAVRNAPGTGAKSLADELAGMPGSAGFAVARLDESGPVMLDARLPDQLFAIGSAFKLWVLDAVAEEVAQGRLTWAQVVPLGPRSLLSGVTQDWPAGMPVTVETLATQMISISDNTATDTLIRLLGRERVEARVAASGHSKPAAMHPFLTTSDAFRLKLGPQAARDAYARSDGIGRSKIVNDLPAGIDVAPTDMSGLAGGKPVAIDSIEWFASPADMVRVLDTLRRRSDPQVMAVLGVAPGMAPELRRSFTAVGYKGGSEGGVLNLSWVLRRASGTWYVVTASWNNPAAPIDNSRLEWLAQRMIGQTK